MANLTISIDDQLLRAAKVYAAQKGTSISRLVRDHLSALATRSPEGDPLALFSAGEIGRHEAMRLLGVDYGRLIERLAERGLALPRLDDAATEAMADEFVRVWREAAERA